MNNPLEPANYALTRLPILQPRTPNIPDRRFPFVYTSDEINYVTLMNAYHPEKFRIDGPWHAGTKMVLDAISHKFVRRFSQYAFSKEAYRIFNNDKELEQILDDFEYLVRHYPIFRLG